MAAKSEKGKGTPKKSASKIADESTKKASPKAVSPGVENPGPPKLVRKKKKNTKTSTQKTAARKTTASSSGKVVIRNGGARDTSPQISPAMSNEQAQHQKENTSQLFSSTDANLKMVGGRQLTAAQQSTVEQIQSYLRTNMPLWKGKYPGVEELKVAVMGCVVNGPGESKHANIGISLPGTFEEPKAPVFVDGRLMTTLKGDRIVAEFIQILNQYVDTRYGSGSAKTEEGIAAQV